MPLVHYQLKIWNEIKLPLHEHTRHFTEEQVIEITKCSLAEFLSYLADDKAPELLELSNARWKANQLQIISKLDLVAEDITLINFVRAKSFRNFIPLYTNDITVALALADELDSIFTGSTTTSINTYIEILKEQISNERKKTEQKLTEKTIALEQSNESLQQFAFVASHDLQEPVRQIGTFTDIVLTREKNLAESSLYYLKKAFNYTVRMRQMLDDIMAYSTLTHKENKELTNLGQIVDEATQLLSETIELKNGVVKTDGLPEASVIPAQIRQLFKNLISNALKFSREGAYPHIRITHRWLCREQVNYEKLAIADRYLEVTVDDNGIGFENKYADKIFELFSRLHTRNAYEGSGLGLAISKRIIDNHGGIIFASAHQDKGASFTFLLPQ
jgi:signal transduction histidine kinase